MNKIIMSTNLTLCLEHFKICLYLPKFMTVLLSPIFLFLILSPYAELCIHAPVRQCNTAALHLQSSSLNSSVTSLTKTSFHHYYFNMEYWNIWSSINGKSLLHCVFGWFLFVHLFALRRQREKKELVLFPVPTFKKLLAAFLERQ